MTTRCLVERVLNPDQVEPGDIVQAVDNVPVTPVIVRIVVQDLLGKYHEFKGAARWSGHKAKVKADDNQVVTVLRWES